MADEEEEKIVAEAVVITADMPDAMKDVSIATARSAMGEYSIDKDVATAIKKKFDEHAEYMGTWHCIVGKNFGCSITHETVPMKYESFLWNIELSYERCSMFMRYMFFLFFHDMCRCFH